MYGSEPASISDTSGWFVFENVVPEMFKNESTLDEDDKDSITPVYSGTPRSDINEEVRGK